MLKRYTKLSVGFAMLTVLLLSSNSFAGDVYGKVGYGHYPFKVVIGYSDHGKHKRHKYYKHRSHYNKHYYAPRHYRHHSYYERPRAHYYKAPRRYCRSPY